MLTMNQSTAKLETVRSPGLGDRVIFMTGPFEGRDGVVAALEPTSELAMIKVNVFGHDREVPVRLGAIRLADPTDSTVGSEVDHAGTPTAPASWQLTQEVGRPHLFALFIRDSYRLAVEPDPTIPPELNEVVPDLSGRMNTSDRAAASTEWARWWLTVAGLEGGNLESRRLINKISSGTPVADPPKPEPTDVNSVLQQAIAECQDDAQDFVRRTRRRLIESGPHAHFVHQDIDEVLDGLSRRTGRSKNSFQAEVTLIDVRGSWWTATSSGDVLASLAALRSRQTVLKLLSTAFR